MDDPNRNHPLWRDAAEAERAGDWKAILSTRIALVAAGAIGLCGSIGEIYERGADGITADTQSAISWYIKGITDSDESLSHFFLGRLYYVGNGFLQDFEKARFHFEKASSKGDKNASLYLGRIYFFGFGRDRDLARSRQYLEPLLIPRYVSAYRIISAIDLEEGRTLSGVILRLKGILLTITIVLQNPADPRLS